jgi:pimeloyl-ACP methyl ester carboxylesterase
MTLASAARDVFELVKQTDMDGGKIHLIGVDWGAELIKAAINTYPDLFHSVVLIGVPPCNHHRSFLQLHKIT